MTFKVPTTAVAAMYKDPALPSWAQPASEVQLEQVSQLILEMEQSDSAYQNKHRSVFGMVKLIDDNVGKLLETLKELELANNTIVVFTSDHGDMMGEHGRDNAGTPYKTSAGIPFAIRWPDMIPAGKVIRSPYSTVDFAATLLKMLGRVDSDELELDFQGIDASRDLFNEDLEIADVNQVRYTQDASKGRWAAALTKQYKLILSQDDSPWMFDMDQDPDEIVNIYNQEGYENISSIMRQDLYNATKTYDFSLRNADIVLYDKPACQDTKDRMYVWKYRVCADLKQTKFRNACRWKNIQENCPTLCGLCTEDSEGEILWKMVRMSCSDIGKAPTDPIDGNLCWHPRVLEFCPKTCASMLPI